jgi:hypothetical protein
MGTPPWSASSAHQVVMISSARGKPAAMLQGRSQLTGRRCLLRINPSKAARKYCETPGNSADRAIHRRIATAASENRTPTTTFGRAGNRPSLYKMQCPEVKKNPITLNAGQPLSDQFHVGAKLPPRGYIRRERPSTPSAYMALTRPVVPPDGSFIFCGEAPRSPRRRCMTTGRLIRLRMC